jgi:hypothetical protein
MNDRPWQRRGSNRVAPLRCRRDADFTLTAEWHCSAETFAVA